MTLPTATTPAWQLSAAAYQARAGVHRPWIGEISGVQYARMGKQGQRNYQAKRDAEWKASGDCYDAWKAAITSAFGRGEFSLDTPALHPEAKDRIIWQTEKDRKAAQVVAARAAREARQIHDVNEVKPGERVHSHIYGSATVVKVNRKTVGIQTASGFKVTVAPGLIERLA